MTETLTRYHAAMLAAIEYLKLAKSPCSGVTTFAKAEAVAMAANVLRSALDKIE